MPMYYIAENGEIGDYRHREIKEVKARSAEAAAIEEASALFESGDFDKMSPLTVIVAEDKDGKNAREFKVSRHEEITHTIDASREIDVADESEDD